MCGGCRDQNPEIYKQLEPKPNQPIAYPDGTVRFYGRAPDIEGYEHDPDDETIIRPKQDTPCMYRVSGLLLQTTGNYTINHVCNCTGCPLQYHKISLDDCAKCEHRSV